MNYRHIYHAGNFADIFKHLLLTIVLGYLQNKDKGLFALDAFAGCGLYDLNSLEARKTGEFAGGIQAFMDTEFLHSDLSTFQETLKPYYRMNLYPGSPLLIAERLRPQDRLYANELHPEDVQTLRTTLSQNRSAKILHMDAYESVKAHVPPTERRGLILVDPPFERKDEFQMIGRHLSEWIKRWATGCYMIWYPIKAGSPSHDMFDAALELNAKNILVSECLVHPRQQKDSFNGCGVMIVNAPFGISERIDALAPELCRALKGREIATHWLRDS